tara:strand:- start:560 stop:1306 length:747 start_codon:yes stop_codon:yes gene_type:complete
MEISEILILLFLGLVSGIINTLAGGGSLITLPVMIFMGIPPIEANGTNRIQLIFQNISAIYGFKSKGISYFRFSSWLSLSALLGAILGATIAINFPEDLFKKLLSIIMIFVMFSFFIKEKRKKKFLNKNKIKNKLLSFFLFFLVGIYGGFIHAGVGFFIILILSKVNELKISHSNSIKVFVALIFSLSAFLIFLYDNKVNWVYGINLGIGSAAGGWLASRWSYNVSDKIMKIILSIIISIMSISLWIF